MDLSLQALPLTSWQVEGATWTTRGLRCSSSQLGSLARKSQLRGPTRCSAIDGEGEKPASTQEKPEGYEKPSAKSAISWSQKEADADPYVGWNSNGLQQSNGNSAVGWIKVGGVAILALGFALGARTVYARRAVAKEFAVPPPATEESLKPSSIEPHVVEAGEDTGGLANSDHTGSVEEKKGSFRNGSVGTKHDEKERTSDQVSLLRDATCENVGNEQEDSSVPHDVEDTESTLETSASNVTLPATSEEMEEKGFALGSPTEPSEGSGGSEALEIDFGYDDEATDVRKGGGVEAESSQNLMSAEGDDVEDDFAKPDDLTDTNHEAASGDRTSAALESVSGSPDLDSPMQDDGAHENPISDFEDLANPTRGSDLEKVASEHDDWIDRKPLIVNLGSERRFTSGTITAPSTPSESLPKTIGRVVVPAPADHMQEQILAALQALKVIEGDVKPGDICTRREYARWLVAASATLTRSPAHKVFPAMYIEDLTALAYDDVTPEDKDFPFIQGLAEAGLLSSRLLNENGHLEKEGLEGVEASVFSPDSLLTRQDLVTWKVALGRKQEESPQLSAKLTKEELKGRGQFIDLDKIQEDAWPALLADIKAGEQSIIALAFGHTRRLQPEKPVTKAQAAVAIATGEAWELVLEELARFEADSIAEAAVVAELAMETKAQQEVAAAFQELLDTEREKQQAAASLAEATRAELERIKAEWEEEKLSLLKERAALESQKELFTNMRLDMEAQALALSSSNLAASFEREQADKLRTEAEEEKALISKIRTELEIEKKALMLARSWAEDEARKALAHAKVLEQARNRWESGGVQVSIAKELQEAEETVNSCGPDVQYSEPLTSEAQKSLKEVFISKTREGGRMVVEAILRFLHFIQLIFYALKERSVDLFGKVSGKLQEARIKCVDSTSKTVEGLKQTVPSSLANIRDGTLKVVDEWKEGAGKLSQKFKTS